MVTDGLVGSRRISSEQVQALNGYEANKSFRNRFIELNEVCVNPEFRSSEGTNPGRDSALRCPRPRPAGGTKSATTSTSSTLVPRRLGAGTAQRAIPANFGVRAQYFGPSSKANGRQPAIAPLDVGTWGFLGPWTLDL